MNPETTATPPGLFIAFEGGEGAGKTSQIQHLASALAEAGRAVTLTREPGGSALGRHLRQILLSPETGHIDPRAEALLFAADRAQHVATVIRPALDAGQAVLTDRYMDSSAAYQGAGRGLSREEIIDLSLWAAEALTPDLTIVLDIDPRVGLARATRSEFGAADRIESEAVEFADAVRAGFLALAARDPHRYLVLDATQSEDVLAVRIRDMVMALTEQQAA